MNIFYLHPEPDTAAIYHNDKHVNKMIIEYGQLLSTAHRILDGELTFYIGKNGRNKKHWQLPDNYREQNLYLAGYYNHKCNVWVRESKANYLWLYNLFCALCEEFRLRYKHTHATSSLIPILYYPPSNIADKEMTPLPLAMPDTYKTNDALTSYRSYYIHEKAYFSTWKVRGKPHWFKI
jgi:hypothetical protein